MKKFWLFALLFATLSSLTIAQNNPVVGTWVAKAVNRTITLKITEENNTIAGNLEGMGEPFTLTGKVNGVKAEGTASSASGDAFFSFIVTGDNLNLTLMNFDTNGKPDNQTAVTVSLERDFGPKVQAGFSVPGFAPPPEDPLIASWQNSSILISIKANGTNKYVGNITINKVKTTFAATGKASSLKGSFKLSGKNKTFTAKLENDRLKFVLDGKTYMLGRVR